MFEHIGYKIGKATVESVLAKSAARHGWLDCRDRRPFQPPRIMPRITLYSLDRVHSKLRWAERNSNPQPRRALVPPGICTRGLKCTAGAVSSLFHESGLDSGFHACSRSALRPNAGL